MWEKYHDLTLDKSIWNNFWGIIQNVQRAIIYIDGKRDITKENGKLSAVRKKPENYRSYIKKWSSRSKSLYMCYTLEWLNTYFLN